MHKKVSETLDIRNLGTIVCSTYEPNFDRPKMNLIFDRPKILYIKLNLCVCVCLCVKLQQKLKLGEGEQDYGI